MSDSQEETVPLTSDPIDSERVSITPVLFATYPCFIVPQPVILRLTRKKGLGLDGVVFKVISTETNQLYFEFIQKFGHGTLQFLVDYTGKPLLKVKKTDAFTSTIVGGNERVIGQVRYYSRSKPFLKKYVINYTDCNLGDQVLTAMYEQGTKNVEFRLESGTSGDSPWLAKMTAPGMFDAYQLEIRPGVDIGFMALLGCLRAQKLRKSALLSPQETRICPLSYQHVSNATVIYNISRSPTQLCCMDNPVIFTPHGDENQAPCFSVEAVSNRKQLISTVTTDGVQVPFAKIKTPFSILEAACCTPSSFFIDRVTNENAQRLNMPPKKVLLCLRTATACWHEPGDIVKEIKLVSKVAWDPSLEFHLAGPEGHVAIAQMSKATPKEKGWQGDKDHWGQLEITSGVDLSLMVALANVCVIRMFPK